ncbi:undecaprenyl pyrophosphate synthetase [Methanocella paludicola SANAE]|uniref:Tritrans,polycis-undecaprenyl-diphosphate synthase (geranylgeranyl-diphosphate specific) n=1 Tax=Methanocella paludicola (strain DSM 17711 / JCM 13418 / NBRC 101707 / SANAE) TaxID=304371 RepID=D1YZL7_METPS|nr:polyprenyl diphosphate synthase [Methanocella paludicola]BAI61889.1 undecaprenyl pyrophosphate synthetase [Methanocella paludicola SANAE]
MQIKSFLWDLYAGWYEHIPVLYRWYEHSLKRDVLRHSIPQHVAIIQDGNRRYAKRLGKSVEQGHIYGADTTEKVLDWCGELGIRQLTLYAFSTENFKRPEQEKKALFDLFKHFARQARESKRTHESKLRIRSVGDISMLPQDVKDEIALTEAATATYDKFYLNVAVAYGGRQEIVDGARKMAKEVKSGSLEPENITEEMVDKYLYFGSETRSQVDLIIRTGGDERTSNFLPWQASGNECAIYIAAPFWPEFRKIDFIRAVRAYQSREKEHRVKLAVSMLKMKRHNGGFNRDEFRDSLVSALKVSPQEAESILASPLVKKELAKIS